ncbi:hypothetical protein EON65_53180 [archaeon]|nr:MAG: hypothetical protein EON65_53180 [archaeon]
MREKTVNRREETAHSMPNTAHLRVPCECHLPLLLARSEGPPYGALGGGPPAHRMEALRSALGEEVGDIHRGL